MPWWGWIAMGAMLLGAELAVVDAEFYLVFLGISAGVVGVLRLLGISSVWWLDWLIFAGLALVTMVTFRRRVYARLRGGVAPFDDAVVGQTVVVSEPLDPGTTGRGEFRGTTWSVANVGAQPIAAGQRVQIHEVDGLTLKVRGG